MLTKHAALIHTMVLVSAVDRKMSDAELGLIGRLGNVPATELYEVFNMGVGFCAVVRPDAAERTA